VVKEGRILHFVSGYMRYMGNGQIILRKVKAEAEVKAEVKKEIRLTAGHEAGIRYEKIQNILCVVIPHFF
jgi:hypothetical protein